MPNNLTVIYLNEYSIHLFLELVDLLRERGLGLAIVNNSITQWRVATLPDGQSGGGQSARLPDDLLEKVVAINGIESVEQK